MLEVAIHEWFAVGSLKGLEYITVASLIANGKSLTYQYILSEEVDFSATHTVCARAHESAHASLLVC